MKANVNTSYLWIVLIMCIFYIPASSQQPDYVFEEPERDSPKQCVSPEETRHIRHLIDSTNQEFRRQGVFEKYFDAQRRAAPPLFQWPMRQAEGFNDPGYYALSNYVDLDPTSPGVLDYNGLNQTYDGHNGIDIRTSPYFWLKKQNNHVEAVAAADGVISLWQDDNFDDNCSCTGTWNAVFLTHADGAVTWYGHLKTNTLTTKTIGDFVAVGEYIGLIGSSGCSSNPHLHFETYDNLGNLIEPFAGPSNATTTNSWWANQLPYYDAGINKIATHSAGPSTPSCPGIEVPNEKDVFDPGEAITFSIAVRHSVTTDSAKLEVFEPDGDQSTLLDLTYIRTGTFFQRAILPIWNMTLANDAPKGKWLFKATYFSDTYGVQVVNKDFWVAESCQANIVHNANLGTNAYYQASNTISSTADIINNAQIIYDAENVITLSPGFRAPVGCKFEVKTAGCN